MAGIKQLEKQIATAVRQLPDGEIFTSLFKGDVITAAELMTEIGDCRARYPTRANTFDVLRDRVEAKSTSCLEKDSRGVGFPVDGGASCTVGVGIATGSPLGGPDM